MKLQLKHFLFALILLFVATGSYAQKGKSKPKSSKYDYQGPYCDGLARVKINQKWGFIDTTGNVVVPPKYNQVENFVDGLAKVRTGQRWGLVDKTGAVIIKPTFEWIYDFNDGIAKVKIDGEEYYMDRNGQRVK
jgi:hypothetical protein